MVGFTALDTLYWLVGPRTTGWAGPHAGYLLQLAVDLSLLLLIRFPRAVCGLALAAGTVMLASDLFAPGLFVPTEPLSLATVPTCTPVICGAAVRLLGRREGLWFVGAMAVVAARPWSPDWAITPFGLLITAGSALISLYAEARGRLLDSLRDRAERAEREKHLLAEQARFAERRRLASEMHDVVTHRLSLIVLHAGALGVSSPDPAARAAAEDIRTAGTQALDELRDLVGVLRSSPSEVDEEGEPTRVTPEGPPPDPALLAAESGAVGIPVDYAADGSAADVSPAVARTVHRVVQEALTNVRKHAPGSAVTARLRYRPDGVRVTVTNTAPAGPPDPVLATRGSGVGLAGLRQRVELLGGSLTAGPATGGGFEVSAILPAYVPTAEASR
ncbi:sensor histidine kinase [Amycolatopsis suaedae]|uniref:histidine kinase n=1 Tax=Amycolatopsis suaedae TaxID=2510978 RepID=A0A4Q7IY45_9PSEU|nr:histidine kinase [Amycolatopsis suaedae]RZQ59881.1 two-component sensor histidine kinase [Amycolatopsis suaedae]